MNKTNDNQIKKGRKQSTKRKMWCWSFCYHLHCKISFINYTKKTNKQPWNNHIKSINTHSSLKQCVKTIKATFCLFSIQVLVSLSRFSTTINASVIITHTHTHWLSCMREKAKRVAINVMITCFECLNGNNFCCTAKVKDLNNWFLQEIYLEMISFRLKNIYLKF